MPLNLNLIVERVGYVNDRNFYKLLIQTQLHFHFRYGFVIKRSIITPILYKRMHAVKVGVAGSNAQLRKVDKVKVNCCTTLMQIVT